LYVAQTIPKIEDINTESFWHERDIREERVNNDICSLKRKIKKHRLQFYRAVLFIYIFLRSNCCDRLFITL